MVIDAIVGDVDGKNVIVIDDEIANGGTIIEVLRKLRERQVKRISVVCTHGLFTGGAIMRLGAQPDIEEIVTTNTVPIPAEKRLPNMRVLSVAPLLAETIHRIHVGKSVSALFDGKPIELSHRTSAGGKRGRGIGEHLASKALILMLDKVGMRLSFSVDASSDQLEAFEPISRTISSRFSTRSDSSRNMSAFTFSACGRM